MPAVKSDQQLQNALPKSTDVEKLSLTSSLKLASCGLEKSTVKKSYKFSLRT